MKIECQLGKVILDSNDIKCVRQEGEHVLAVDKHGLAFSLGTYKDVGAAINTLKYVLSDTSREHYKMYKEEL